MRVHVSVHFSDHFLNFLQQHKISVYFLYVAHLIGRNGVKLTMLLGNFLLDKVLIMVQSFHQRLLVLVDVLVVVGFGPLQRRCRLGLF